MSERVPRITILTSALLVILFIIGCEKTVSVGGNFTISASPSPDGQTHHNILRYNGTKICDNVGLTQYHDGVLVFISLENSQLYAVRAAGPMVMLSKRIVDRVITLDPLVPGQPRESIYEARDLKPSPDGVTVQFYVNTNEKTGVEEFESHNLTWKQIDDWISEAQRTEPVIPSKSGDYRILHRS